MTEHPGDADADVRAEIAELGDIEHAWSTVVLLVALLAFSNVMANRVLPAWSYVPWNLTMAAALVGTARRRDRITAAELGAARADLGRGVRWGGVGAAVVAVLYGVAMAVPATRTFFEDRRASADGWTILYRAVVAVPLGTVLLEEVTFRGVLPAVLARRTTWWRAAGWSSVLFGFWHVLPSWNLNSSNEVASSVAGGHIGRLVTVGFAVGGTFAAGMVFCWLRDRSASLAAPIVLHVSTNSLAYLGAWLVLR